ncbi:MAG: YdeI/OmpD-associated family protein [Hyphomonadaceae bacterium]
MARALHAGTSAKINFEAFPSSSKRIILEWISAAKRSETRARRNAETAEKAANNVGQIISASHPAGLLNALWQLQPPCSP